MSAHTDRSRREATKEYRTARDAFSAKRKRADAAFKRYFEKREAGVETNGAAWQRLENQANELSVALHNAQSRLFRLDMDPWDIDDADGVERSYVA